jgi:hypothetical protein
VEKGWRPRTLTPDAPPAKLEVKWPHRVVLAPEFSGERLEPPHPGRLIHLVEEGEPRVSILFQVWAGHSGFRVCDIRRAVGEQTIGLFVVTLPFFSQSSSTFEAGREYWWWDPTRTPAWPDGFRLVPRPDQTLPEFPGVVWEKYPWSSFDGAPIGAIDVNPSIGSFYQLSRLSQGQHLTIDAHLWAWAEGGTRRQSWFTREVDADACLPFRNDEELVFNRLSPLTAWQGDGRRILRVVSE